MKITLQARNDKFEETTYNIIKKYKKEIICKNNLKNRRYKRSKSLEF